MTDRLTRHEPAGDWLYGLDMSIHPAWRGRGGARLAGLRANPTLTPQQKIGFRPLALIPDYLDDPVCGNFGVLLRLDAGQEV